MFATSRYAYALLYECIAVVWLAVTRPDMPRRIVSATITSTNRDCSSSVSSQWMSTRRPCSSASAKAYRTDSTPSSRVSS